MTRTSWLICAVLLAASFGASGLVYANRDAWLPESVPVHWGINFQPDNWAPRDHLFWYLMAPPLAMLIVALLLPPLIFWLSPRGFEPGKDNPRLVNYLVVLVIGLIAVLHAVILMGYLNQGTPLPQLMMGAIFLFFILLGNVLGKVQRNFWIGIRTPWTLANHVVWEKTHRLGAWLFVAAGVFGLGSLVFSGMIPLAALIVFWAILIFGSALVPVIYSLVLYKRLEREGRLGEV
jgi:uncharacterized membrane protein